MAGKKKVTAGDLMRDPTGPVTIEYSTGKKRSQKTFEEAHEARAFYAAKDKAGRNPRVLGDTAAPAAEPTPEPAATPAPAPAKQNKKLKEAPTAPAKKEGPTGVVPKRGRPYLAGLLLQKYGHANGITDAMVEELDKMHGKPNAVQSKFDLSSAWHSIRGYLEAAKEETK